MALNTFEFIGKTENKTRLYFKKYCWENSHVFCTRCRSYKVYRIRGKRYGANGAAISSMTLPADGLIGLRYRIRNGFGL
jgi:hypothetical protein